MRIFLQLKIGKQDFHIDPAILFIRLLVLAERSVDLVYYFQYELRHHIQHLYIYIQWIIYEACK